ncbi:alpha/beta hydrolase [Streptoalloteichus hindustanus]|uniref:S-formylglutathione hydrolase FrmB n=1 Tax=Streptoalloteichus hindustanus TaxID=2017 RepID=A0A1M4UK84_STRHI|nr:alpha/beta hydrolase family protein [Streptoalloteichus hindustanus]SHE56973.1 S-formylglutathione hydrolase FrmB [Streptoalloteichus hindustanus]
MRPARRPLPTLLALLIGVMAALTATPALAAPPVVPAEAPAQAASAPAHVVAEKRVSERVLDVTVWSPALRQKATARLLLPVGWDRGSGRHWPTLWLLAGCCSLESHTGWTAFTDVEDRPELRDVLVVMPDAGLAGFYSDWWNGGRGGVPGWETFHLGELRTLLERDYGAGARRAVAGLSMGGFGALSYAARHPGMFRAAASYSGLVHNLHPGGPQYAFPTGAAFVQALVKASGDDPNALWGDPEAQRHVWAAHNPYDLAVLLRRIPVHISAGTGEPGPLDAPGKQPDRAEALLHAEAVDVADRLRALGGRVTTTLGEPGTHDWPYWERELHKSLPMLLDAIRN